MAENMGQAMEGPEHRIRRAEAVLRKLKERSGSTENMSADELRVELRAVLGDVWDMANEVIKANQMFERQARDVNRPTVAAQAAEAMGRKVVDHHGLMQRLEADNMRMAAEMEKRAAPLNELDVRHIVASELARVMLAQVLVGENSQLLATSKNNAEQARKLDQHCTALVADLKKMVDERDKWKADSQRWAQDYLTLARMLGVAEEVRDRSVVALATERAVEMLTNGRNASIDMAESVVKHALDSFGESRVHVANLREFVAKRIAELRATIGAL